MPRPERVQGYCKTAFICCEDTLSYDLFNIRFDTEIDINKLIIKLHDQRFEQFVHPGEVDVGCYWKVIDRSAHTIVKL